MRGMNLFKLVFLLLAWGVLPANQVTPPPPALPPTEQPKPLPELPPPVTPAPEQMMQDFEGAGIKMFVALMALLVGIFFAVWILKKVMRGGFGKRGSQDSINILEKKPLSQKTVLYLIEIEGKKALIAESQLEVKSLISYDAVEEKEDNLG